MTKTKCLKLISNHSMVVSGTYYNPFQGLFTHSGAWGGLRSHILSWPIYKFKGIYIQKKVLDQNKKAQTHLKSFNGRQWGIFQSISGVSGASGGLRSQNFDFLTQKFKMAVFARFHFLKSKNPISGHN